MPLKDLSNAEVGTVGLGFESMLQECLACGSLTVSPDGEILALSPEAERTLQLAPAKDQSRLLTELPPPIQALVREAQRTGKGLADHKLVVRPANLGAIVLSVTTVPIITDENRVTVVVLLKDRSSAGKLEYNLRRLDRLATVGTLSAGMAHEIKNALVAIKTFVDLLLEKDPEIELAGVVRREMGRVDSILSQMLKFSAPGQPVFASIRLHDVLDHSLRLAQHGIGHKAISLERRFNASNDTFNGDDHQLEQAFVNLLFNAVDAMGPEGTITVTTELVAEEIDLQMNGGTGASEFLMVKIADSGVGIPPENLARIFEPFFTTKQSGTGLGLLVTRRIIEEHYGVIRVESRPGQGTTFTVLLPAGAKAP